MDTIDIDEMNEVESFPVPELPKPGDKLVTESHSRTDMLWGEWLDWNQYADGYKESALVCVRSRLTTVPGASV